MKRSLLAGVGLCMGIVLSFAGCTQRPQMLGPDAGMAYYTQRDQQTLNPEAKKNMNPVEGLEDGPAAKNTMERFRASFEKPEDYRTKVQNPSVVNQGIVSTGS